MYKKQLELIDLIAGSYKKNKLAAIEACIKSMDVMMNVRCLGYNGAAANEAYLDNMRLTRREFIGRPVIKSFSDHDINNGLATITLESFSETIRNGGGGFITRIWNGKDHLPVMAQNIVVAGYSIATFTPVAEVQAARPGICLASRLCAHRQYKDLRLVSKSA